MASRRLAVMTVAICIYFASDWGERVSIGLEKRDTGRRRRIVWNTLRGGANVRSLQAGGFFSG
eukprot:1374259-Amorphochlora_amoeboformis.AAC.1